MTAGVRLLAMNFIPTLTRNGRCRKKRKKIHGLNDAFLADKQKFADIAERLCNFLSAAEVIIHNAKFDLGFFKCRTQPHRGVPPINEVVENVICSLNLSRRINIGLRRHSLDVLCAHFGVDAASRQEGHGAMIDARLLGKVYIAMTRGQVAMSIPTGVASVAMEAGGDVPVRLATQSEKAAHEKNAGHDGRNKQRKTVMASLAHLHFVGIAGSFMVGAARLAAECGYKVSGSDTGFYPPMGEQARNIKATLFEDYDSDVKSRPADCYIIGNALSRGNPLVESILREHRPYISGPQWLYENILRGKTTLAVAGTHGKTTTASLLSWILEGADFFARIFTRRRSSELRCFGKNWEEEDILSLKPMNMTVLFLTNDPSFCTIIRQWRF